MRKLIAFVVCLLLLVAFSSVAFAASGSNYTTNSSLATKLDNLLGGVKLFSNLSDKIGVNSEFSADTKFNWGSGSTYDQGWQCYAYANAAYYYLFGESPGEGDRSYTKSKKISGIPGNTEWSEQLLTSKGVGCGACFRTSSSSSPHSMIILSYNASTITILHAIRKSHDTNNSDYHRYIVKIEPLSWKKFYEDRLKGKSVKYFLQPNLTAGEVVLPEVPEMTDGTAPKEISNGSSFTLKGTIYCKYNITEVRGIIYNCSTGTKVFDVAVNPNKTSYTLGTSGETINSSLGFGDSRLNNSWCRYELKVTYNKNGTTCIKRLYDRYFKVGSPANMTLAQPGVYEFACDEEARSGPAESNSIVKKYNKGDIVFVTGYEINSSSNAWLKLSDGSYVFSGDLNRVTWTETAINETYTFTSYVEAKKYPYSSATTITTYTSGAEASVAASLTNTNGEIWYRLSNDSYVPASYMRKDIPVTGVSLNKSSLTLNEGETETLTATIAPSNASNQSVTWSSNKTSVATVDSTGKVTAKAAGSANITVTTADGGKTATCTVTVRPITGVCGANLAWSYSNGTLSISGSGAMYEYELGAFPWNNYLGSIKEINMTGGTTISDYAFYNGQTGTTITKVTLPSTLTYIGINAFYYAMSLKTVNIPDSVKTIAESAFRRCNSLDSIHLPSSLTYIPSGAFWHCNVLQHVDIPESVTAIGPEAFAYTGLTSIDIPESVTSIGNGAFMNSALQTVNLPSKLSSLGRYSFQDCANLNTVIVRAMDTIIGGEAFYNCPNLTIYCIEGSQFHYCAASTSNNWPYEFIGGLCGEELKWETIGNILEISGSGAMYEYELGAFPWNNYLGSIKEINMTGGTTISDYAFYNGQTGTTITKVTLPSTLTYIGINAFYYAMSLKTVNIPDSVKTIAESAFRRCNSLDSIHLPSSLTYIPSGAFWHCNVLQHVDIPESVTAIGPEAFAYTGLTSIDIPESVTSIGNGAFMNSALQTVNLPSKLSSLGRYSFQDCANLNTVIVRAMDTIIGGEAFYNCPNLTIYCIEGSQFHYCAASTSNNWPYEFIGGLCGENVWWWSQGSKLFITGTGDMYSYYNTELPWGNNITSVEVYSGVTTIGKCAFYNCASLIDVILPETLRNIDSMSFEYCSALETISIPDGVEQIGPCAFCYDHKLTTVSLPGSVTDIGYAAFSGCDQLTGIILDSTSTYSIYEGALISPDGRLVSYFVGNNHTEFTVPQWVTAIDKYAFMRCTSLEEIEIPESVETIGEYAFNSCNSQLTLRCWDATAAHTFALTHNINYRLLNTHLDSPDFMIPNGVTVIGEEAFAGIAAKRIKLPEGTTKICALAFSSCPNLIAIYIPEGCTSIADDAFEGVNRLTIYGKDGSEAKTFADKHNYGFVIVTNTNP